jgi:hypothetical protein
MKAAPYIDPQGVARERERAPYTVALISEGGEHLIAFLPVSDDRLTCLEFVRVFTIPLRPGIDPEVARALVASLREHVEGLDAVYEPEPGDHPPTYPNIIPLRAA